MARPKKEAAQASTTDYVPDSEAQDEPKVEIVAESEPKIAKNDVKSADEGIAELKRKYEEAEQGRLKAERERNEAVQRAYTANNEKEDTNLRLIESAISQVAANSSMLEQGYADALTSGDTVRAAKIMREMAANEAKALQLQNGKQSIQEAPRSAPRPLDPIEDFIVTNKLGPRPAAWIRSHPEYALNPKLTQKMIAADNLVVADGLERGSDAYFEAVEDTLKINLAARQLVMMIGKGSSIRMPLLRGQGGQSSRPLRNPRKS